jgi:hypothetical protein
LQDRQREGTFARIHTLFLACTYQIWLLLAWQLCEFHTETVRGALLSSCWLFASHFSAIDSLQECSRLFEELKGGAAFTG